MRRKSRELALQLLFQREFAPQVDFDEFIHLFEEKYDKETVAYAHELVDGVSAHKDEIDQQIQAASRHWKVERMSVVDRSILRMACFELKKLNLQPKIAIDEAVELAKKYGNTESGAFVNGILDQISKGR
jgi:transcription antitermination protein NusB